MSRILEQTEPAPKPAYQYVGEFTPKHGPSAENAVKDNGYAKLLRLENNYLFVGELYNAEIRHLLARRAELVRQNSEEQEPPEQPDGDETPEQTSLEQFSKPPETGDGEGAEKPDGEAGDDAGDGAGDDGDGDTPPEKTDEEGEDKDNPPEQPKQQRYSDMTEEEVLEALKQFGIEPVDGYSYCIDEQRFDVMHRHSDLKRVTTKTTMLRLSCCADSHVYVTDDNALVCAGCARKVYLDFVKAPKNIKV